MRVRILDEIGDKELDREREVRDLFDEEPERLEDALCNLSQYGRHWMVSEDPEHPLHLLMRMDG